MRTRIGYILAAVLIASAVAAGCSVKQIEQNIPAAQAKPVNLETALAQRFGTVEARAQAGQGWVVLSGAVNGGRQVAYIESLGGSWAVAGQPQVLKDADGPATLRVDGDMVIVETKKESAPQYAGFKVGASGLQAINYYEATAPEAAVKTGSFILVNKQLNVLYHYEDGKLVKAYRVATGRQTEPPAPTWQDYRTNFFTPEGKFTITNFVANPPFNALKPGDTSYAGGAPGNPLGTRWMGFAVLNNDNAWLWGIHGTSHPELIGTWASDGCIRMYVNENEELFGQLKGKTPTLWVVAK